MAEPPNIIIKKILYGELSLSYKCRARRSVHCAIVFVYSVRLMFHTLISQPKTDSYYFIWKFHMQFRQNGFSSGTNEPRRINNCYNLTSKCLVWIRLFPHKVNQSSKHKAKRRGVETQRQGGLFRLIGGKQIAYLKLFLKQYILNYLKASQTSAYV